MQLQKLFVERAQSWEKNPGQLHGTIQFTSPKGTIELPLDEGLSKAIIDMCAASIVRAANVVASELVAETLTQVPQLTDASAA